MGTYDLEKEICCVLQDSSKIRDYNAKLWNEYINLNDENWQLKVENFKLVSQNACTEISLAKAKADNFAKSEKVKSLQSVINLLAPGLSLAPKLKYFGFAEIPKPKSEIFLKSEIPKSEIHAEMPIF
ncbi:hypothetical protein C1645_811685 [Glomus cerebriforme]|uniref:Uncharacterized protein n=1 Tax=Glomus cerebriforme TaxID=658196 RepID=A0A397TMM8_9GLOM|nr:hypothetical protein C1645_811685 [Glomus cerebriforme]